MKNTRFTIVLAFLAMVMGFCPLRAQYRSGYSELGDSETVTALKKHVSTVSAAVMEGRKAGSEGEKMTAEYITETLKGYGLDIISGESGDPFGIRQDNGDTLTSRNVCAFIHGGDKSLRDLSLIHI